MMEIYFERMRRNDTPTNGILYRVRCYYKIAEGITSNMMS